ncbi:hypothetical protein QN277_022581 [Acacia crassicarpa]|uniref:Late embryogenesis abundant protein LEA-2 subgroup domain-containing protein n=1 Tax=Acacia crassicarpa TaxID=499986 RepID=A0AAE1MPU0_9FABA|nr:hypothetical protein QN277_022581 [Acacia crassicarpa]
MAASKAIRYTLLLRPFQRKYQDDVVLPIYIPSPTSRQRLIIWVISVVLFLGLVYICWPSDPVLKIERMKLNRIKVHTLPRLAVDISMLVTVKVHNGDVYSMNYKSLDVAVGYRGKKLGHVKSEDGHVRAKGSSYVDARLEFTGIRVLSDVVYFLEDLAKGTVPFDTSTEIEGYLGLLFFSFPMEANLRCEVLVNIANQAIERQKCRRKG